MNKEERNEKAKRLHTYLSDSDLHSHNIKQKVYTLKECYTICLEKGILESVEVINIQTNEESEDFFDTLDCLEIIDAGVELKLFKWKRKLNQLLGEECIVIL